MAEPSDIAVALRYDPNTGYLPQVTAQGRGHVAAQIRALAEAHGVPVRNDADLAELLVRLPPLSHLPPAAFAATAEILAVLYRHATPASRSKDDA